MISMPASHSCRRLAHQDRNGRSPWGGDPDDRWETALVGGRGPWRTAVVRLTDRVELRPRPALTLDTATSADDWVVSRFGSIAAADVAIDGAVEFTAMSVYAAWEKTAAGTLYADGSAHRILSDLSALMPRLNHRLVVAGDWKVLRGYGEQETRTGGPDMTPSSSAPKHSD